MTTLGTRLALAELDDIRSELAALAVKLNAVTAALGGDVLDLRDRARDERQEATR